MEIHVACPRCGQDVQWYFHRGERVNGVPDSWEIWCETDGCHGYESNAEREALEYDLEMQLDRPCWQHDRHGILRRVFP